MSFVISPIPPERLKAMRHDGADDAGERFEAFVAEEDGAPLRCCLREARAGEHLALIAYRPEGTAGAYREIGPVFVHAAPCEGDAAHRWSASSCRSDRPDFPTAKPPGTPHRRPK